MVLGTLGISKLHTVYQLAQGPYTVYYLYFPDWPTNWETAADICSTKIIQRPYGFFSFKHLSTFQ